MSTECVPIKVPSVLTILITLQFRPAYAEYPGVEPGRDHYSAQNRESELIKKQKKGKLKLAANTARSEGTSYKRLEQLLRKSLAQHSTCLICIHLLQPPLYLPPVIIQRLDSCQNLVNMHLQLYIPIRMQMGGA
jgi:hypothetical protein